MAPHTDRPSAYSVNRVAHELSISRAGVYNLAKAGKLRILKIGTRSVVMAEEVDRILAEADELYPTSA